MEARTLLGLEDGGQTRLPLPPRGWCPAWPAPAEPGLCLLQAHRQVPPLVWKKLCPDLILLELCGFTSSPRNFKACSAFYSFYFPPEVTLSSISSEPGITELFPSPVTVGSPPWLLSLASFSALQPALLGFWNVAFIVLLGLLCIRGRLTCALPRVSPALLLGLSLRGSMHPTCFSRHLRGSCNPLLKHGAPTLRRALFWAWRVA